jgi:hypothetical protein
MTGWGAGYCADYDVPGYANRIPSRGRGRGWFRGVGPGWSGGGHGWRHWFHATGQPAWARQGYRPGWWADELAPPAKEDELKYLQREAEWLQQRLDAIQQRVEVLDEE